MDAIERIERVILGRHDVGEVGAPSDAEGDLHPASRPRCDAKEYRVGGSGVSVATQTAARRVRSSRASAPSGRDEHPDVGIRGRRGDDRRRAEDRDQREDAPREHAPPARSRHARARVGVTQRERAAGATPLATVADTHPRTVRNAAETLSFPRRRIVKQNIRLTRAARHESCPHKCILSARTRTGAARSAAVTESRNDTDEKGPFGHINRNINIFSAL